MNRKIKFRVWDEAGKYFLYFNLEEIPHGCATCVAPPQQFTGLKDKNGKALNPPIYFGTAFENGRYKWRVRTICKNGTSGWSKYLEFIVDADGGGQGCKLPAPTLLSPSDNAEVTLSFQVTCSYCSS
jgi:hypothetical protein